MARIHSSSKLSNPLASSRKRVDLRIWIAAMRCCRAIAIIGKPVTLCDVHTWQEESPNKACKTPPCRFARGITC